MSQFQKYFSLLLVTFFCIDLSCASAPICTSNEVTEYVYTSLENRLTILKNMDEEVQPLFIRYNPAVTAPDLIQAVYLNNDPVVLDSLVAYFNVDAEPLFERQQLAEFLSADSVTASIWRNRSSERCVITINTSRSEALFLSIEHEITHVLQHAEMRCVGESAFIKKLYEEFYREYPDALREIVEKNAEYELRVMQFDSLSDQEKRDVSQVLLEYHADIQACYLLKDHALTRQFISSKVACSRHNGYASYALLNVLIG